MLEKAEETQQLRQIPLWKRALRQVSSRKMHGRSPNSRNNDA
jgi:hypothetical protein